MRHVFISYSHDDADFAQIVEFQLSQSHFAVWKDLDLRAGDDWHAEIEAAIRGATAVVVILSEKGQASPYVTFEWAFAIGAGIPVIPLLLKSRAETIHPRLKNLQALDFTNYMLRPWDALVRAIKVFSEAERPFTVFVPRDAPPFIQKAAEALDSTDAEERIAAITLLTEIDDPTVREVLAEAVRHPASDVRDIAANKLAEAKDIRALPAILDAIRHERWDYLNAGSLVDLGAPAIPILVPILREKSQSVRVRGCIAHALGRMLDDQSVDALHELLQSPEEELRVDALKALADYPLALPWILESMGDPSELVVRTALQGLGAYKDPAAVAVLVEAMNHPDPQMRQTAIESLQKVGDRSAIPSLLRALTDEDNFLRFRSRDLLAKLIDVSHVPDLLRIFEESPRKSEVAELLVQFKSDLVVNRLISILAGEDKKLRGAAAYRLGSLQDPSAVPALLLTLNDEEEDVREGSAYSLGKLKDARAVPALIAVLQNEDEFDDVRTRAVYALDEIGTREARIASRNWRRQNGKD